MAHNVSYTKSSPKRGARFTQAKGGTAVRVSPGKGGAGKIGPSHCASTGQHFAKSYGKRGSKGY